MRNAFFNANTDVNAPIHMNTCGYENCVENFCCNTHTRDYYLIHYIIEGEGFYENGGKKYSLSAGEFFVIYPGDLVKYYAPYPDKKWTFAWIGVSGNYVEQYFEQAGIGKDVLVFKRCGAEFLKEITECLKYIDENKSHLAQMMLDGFALKTLATLKSAPKTDESINFYSNVAVQYIKDNYMKGINIGDVVSYLNINRSYFYKVFKRNIGISPQQFLIDYRLEQAVVLLNSGYAVGVAASAVGFNSICSFSGAFKKKYGKSPTKFILSI